ncbi:uncharacterized protein LOC129600261 [Paramacrobiotus metropolitanus]|uniref:uncharacterized protein LOC129600261 n=1 Tax=Paramacrobiotus metropolitanus TaxID=2943436 RepID=UPI0024458CBE|nr:uncharacterized protein LOC129600261 [Paramacrobiotus metropolitanus]
MLIYKDDVCAWNGVDVLVDRQLHHGNVMNVVDGGLMISFGCNTQFIRYGNIFECPRATDHPALKYKPPWHWHAGDNAQVLLRATPSSAWMWYAGKFVDLDDYCQDDSVLVDVQLPGGTVRELLLCQQVRAPLSEEDLAQRRIGEKHFVIRCCPLPDGYWSEECQIVKRFFRQDLEDQNDVLSISVVSHSLLYLQCRTATPLTVEILDILLAEAKTRLAPHLSLHPALRQPNKKCKRKTILRLINLPAEILVQVFQSLDSIGRIRCRRVCSLWNRLLTTDAYFPDVRVSGRAADLPNGPQHEEMHWVVSCLLKCVTSRTRAVVISHLDIGYRCLRCAVLISHIRQAVRLPALVFYQCEFGGDFQGEITIAADIKDMLKLWESSDRVVWKQCRIYDDRVQAVMAQYGLNAQPAAQLETQLWDLVERNLVLKKPLDLPALAEWIADCIAKKHRQPLKDIITALWEYQSVDPRLPTEYRNRKWRVTELTYLDVQKLTRVTAAALSDVMDAGN